MEGQGRTAIDATQQRGASIAVATGSAHVQSTARKPSSIRERESVRRFATGGDLEACGMHLGWVRRHAAEVCVGVASVCVAVCACMGIGMRACQLCTCDSVCV